jgi:hypothetical protein
MAETPQHRETLGYHLNQKTLGDFLGPLGATKRRTNQPSLSSLAPRTRSARRPHSPRIPRPNHPRHTRPPVVPSPKASPLHRNLRVQRTMARICSSCPSQIRSPPQDLNPRPTQSHAIDLSSHQTATTIQHNLAPPRVDSTTLSQHIQGTRSNRPCAHYPRHLTGTVLIIGAYIKSL